MTLKKFLDEKIEEILLVITMVVMVILIFYQVMSRYIFNDSPSWTEELARYIHIWQVWIGASFAVRMKKHIGVEVFKDLFSLPIRRWIELLSLLLWFCLAAILAYEGTHLVMQIMERGQLSPAMRMPIWIAYAAVPVGTALMSIRLIQQIVWLFTKPYEDKSTSSGGIQ